MELTDAILKRTSVRQWDPKPVEREKIEKVLEAGRRAPSWGNTQPWRFIVVQDAARKEAIIKAAGGQPHLNAPVLIVCCGAMNDLSRKQHRAALANLRDLGVMDWTDDILDNVVLGSDAFAPYRLGEAVMTVSGGRVSGPPHPQVPTMTVPTSTHPARTYQERESMFIRFPFWFTRIDERLSGIKPMSSAVFVIPRWGARFRCPAAGGLFSMRAS